ncbi:MAG: SGNH/GDSL hydrolase family protein [Ignavibacteriaceae bacterium]
MSKKYSLIIILLVLFGTGNAQNNFVPFDDPNIVYEGRIPFRTDAAELTWPATSVSIYFEGTGISAELKDLDTANYFNVIVDEQYFNKFHTDTLRQSYLLASGLPYGKHKIELFKRTEWDKGKTLFYGFQTDDSTTILPALPTKNRKMEFFGNSITCGYAIESDDDSWFGYFQNAYLSYASITARHFNAQMHSTSKSGIGIVLSWFPMIMPEMYDLLDPTDSTSKWDFNRYTPDIVGINLFQNDSWLVKDHNFEEFKRRFGTTEPDDDFIIAAYKKFVTTIREKYPDAHIICSLGSMDATKEGSSWPGYIKKAVEQIDDSKIYTHFFPFKGTYEHPNVDDHKVMAESLIEFIEKNIEW